MSRVRWSLRSRRDLLDREDIREVLVRTYRIVYRVREGEIQVLTVIEGRRLLGSEVQGEADESLETPRI